MFRKTSLLGFLLLLIASCGQSDEQGISDTLRIGIMTEPVTLFPYGSNDVATARATVNIFDRLLEKNGEGNIIPSLATSWELVSPTVLRLTLRSNAIFHNGEQFTAEDVKYSIERMLKSPEIEHIANPIEGVEIIDPYTVNIILKAPFAPILSHLAHSAMAILNKKAAEAAGNDIDQIPVGTGPYKLKEWNRGQNLVLETAPDYWGTAPIISNVVMTVIPEGSARTIALETGDVDIAYDIVEVDRERVIDSSELQLIEYPIARIEYIGFNINKGRHPLFKDIRFREAVSYAIDVNGIINSILFGAATPADSIIYKTVIGHYDGLTPRKRDLEKAKALLAELDIPEDFKISMWTSEGQRQKILEIVQANLREIGIDSSIEVYEWGRYLDGTAKGEHDVFILGWTTVTGDADYGIYNLIHTDAFGGPGNRTFYSNPELDILLEKARVETDPVKRDDMYRIVQETVYNDVPLIPLYYKLANVGASKKITKFSFDLAEAHKFKDISF